MSKKRKFTDKHAKAFTGSGLQFRKNTLSQLDIMLVGIVGYIGKKTGEYLNTYHRHSITLMPEHFETVMANTTLDSDAMVESAKQTAITWEENTMIKRTTKDRNSKANHQLAELIYPTYEEQKVEPKKPGIETLFKDAVVAATSGVIKRLRVKPHVYIMMAAIAEKLMDSIMHSAAIVTREALRKQITIEHLTASYESNAHWHFVKECF